MLSRPIRLPRLASAVLVMLALAGGLAACADVGLVADNTPRSPIYHDHGGLNG